METAGVRKHKRIKYLLNVGCLGSFEVLEGRVSNISEGGLCLEFERAAYSDTPMSLIFRLPTRKRPFVLIGRMQWASVDDDSGRYRCGFEYLWISPEDRDALLGFIGVFKDENEEAGTLPN